MLDTEITEHKGTWNTHSNPALVMKSLGGGQVSAPSLLGYLMGIMGKPEIDGVSPILIQGEKEACGCSWDSHTQEWDLLLPPGQP